MTLAAMIHTHASSTDYFGDNVSSLLLTASVHLITSPWTSFSWSDPGAVTVLPRASIKPVSAQPVVSTCVEVGKHLTILTKYSCDLSWDALSNKSIMPVVLLVSVQLHISMTNLTKLTCEVVLRDCTKD